MPASNHNVRRFSTYSRYDDKRSTREQLAALQELERTTPGSLSKMLSYHARLPLDADFAHTVLPLYWEIAHLMLDYTHDMKGMDPLDE